MQALASQTGDSNHDPHDALRNNHTPTILLYGECNYIRWPDAVDYRKTFPNLKIYYLPRAGHYPQFEQPELTKSVIRAFLLEQPDAIPPQQGDTDPRIGKAR